MNVLIDTLQTFHFTKRRLSAHNFNKLQFPTWWAFVYTEFSSDIKPTPSIGETCIGQNKVRGLDAPLCKSNGQLKNTQSW